jgi:hypothetical protein
MNEQTYEQRPARYAKNMILITIPNNSPSHWKNRGQRLAEALNGRWTHRESGYIMSKRKADRFRQLYDEGWDATSITYELVPPKK